MGGSNLSMADVVCLVCRSYGVYEQAESVCMLCQLYCELLMLLNMAHMYGLYAEGCGVSSAENLVGMWFVFI